MLFTRYANPLPLLNSMIRTSRLNDFIVQISDIRKEEEEDKMLFEVWLHRRRDATYSEFLDEVDRNRAIAEPPTTKTLVNAVQEGYATLQSFSLEKEGEKP